MMVLHKDDLAVRFGRRQLRLQPLILSRSRHVVRNLRILRFREVVVGVVHGSSVPPLLESMVISDTGPKFVRW